MYVEQILEKLAMLELSKILVIIEPGSDSQPALDKALQLARYADSELELMSSDYNAYLEDGYYFDPVQAQKLRYEHGDQHMQELEALAQPLRDQGLEVTVTTAWGNPPYEEIVSRVRDTEPSLVVKSTSSHHKVDRLFLSNEDWELVRYCPAPLLLVKNKQWASNPVFLAAVDPDHLHDKPAALDNKIVGSALALSAISGGDVHLFHSAWVPPLSGIYPLLADAVGEERKLTKLAELNGICASSSHLSYEDIADSLPATAEELNVSAVVMGAVSRSRLDRVLIGNTAEKVMDKLTCDVLIIKPDRMPAQNQLIGRL